MVSLSEATMVLRSLFLLLVAITIALVAAGCQTVPRPPATPDAAPVAGQDGTDDEPSPEPEPPPLGPIEPGGNQRIRSFSEAKRALLQIYRRHRVDLYCGCSFLSEPGRGLRVDLEACGYVVARDPTRARRIEWEHAVAASTFGRTFREWTSGDARCVDGKGKRFKGRRCAARAPEFARMEGDLHNLFPVVGEVNGLRGDLPIGLFDPPERARPNRGAAREVFAFGACKSTIERGVFFPRPEVRGDIARASLYMDRAYPTRRILDEAHRALFERWSADDPPDDWERERDRAIAERQGNANPFIAPARGAH